MTQLHVDLNTEASALVYILRDFIFFAFSFSCMAANGVSQLQSGTEKHWLLCAMEKSIEQICGEDGCPESVRLTHQGRQIKLMGKW